MKKIILMFTGIILAFSYVGASNAAVVDNIGEMLGDTETTLVAPSKGDDPISKVENGGLNIVRAVKLVLSILVFAYIIYIGSMIMTSMGAEDKMKTRKKHFYFLVIAMMFINIPGTIYNVFNIEDKSGVIAKVDDFGSIGENSTNFFFNSNVWNTVVENGIMKSLEFSIILLLIMVFIIAGLQLMISRGNKEKQTAAKNKLTFGVIGLAFLGGVKTWREVAVKVDIDVAQNLLFKQIVNIAIYFAGPIALFFLCWGGYYYITSAGDEAKAKKGKVILTNTFIAIFILLASYSILSDFKNLNF